MSVGPDRGGAATAAAELPQVVATQRRWPRVPFGNVRQAIFIAILLGLSVLFIYPFVWLISASFKPQSQTFDNKLIPETWAWNFDDVFERAPVGTWLFNTIWISGLAALAVTISSGMIAFAFASFR